MCVRVRVDDDICKVASDLREHMEIVHTSEYPSFINSLLNCFVELLKNRLAPQVRTMWIDNLHSVNLNPSGGRPLIGTMLPVYL